MKRSLALCRLLVAAVALLAGTAAAKKGPSGSSTGTAPSSCRIRSPTSRTSR